METVAAAQARILAALVPLSAEPVALADALGRVLAVDVVAGRTLPPFDNSAMDGFALATGSATATPATLPVHGESRAGSAPVAVLERGTATRIMTGAPMPAGADAVVRREDADDAGDAVTVRVAVVAGMNVRRAGEDIRAGETALRRGTRLRPAELAVAAALGVSRLAVARRPRVAVLSTGDELVGVDVEPGPGQIVDSNGVAVAAAVRGAGGEPVPLGIVGDDPDALRARLREAAACDLVVSTAGVSVGDHDHVRDVVAELGSLDLWRVAMRPGKPLAVGSVLGTPFIGLPGNPVSTQVTFELFARPAVLALQGAAEPHRRRVVARALEPLRGAPGLETFVRCVVTAGAEGEPPGVRPTGPQGSGMMRSMVLADGLAVVAAAGGRVEAGALVAVIPLD